MLKLKELRAQGNYTQAEVANTLGISSQAYSNYEAGRREPDFAMLKKMAKFFHVSIDYLLDNDAPQAISNSVSALNIEQLDNYIGVLNETRKIPIIGSVRCGVDGLAFQTLEGYILVEQEYQGNIIAFRCTGDSMKDIGIDAGDIAIVRQQDDVESGEIAVVVINGDEGTLKRVRKFDGGIILESANPKYEPRVFTENTRVPIHIVGKVLEVRKKV